MRGDAASDAVDAARASRAAGAARRRRPTVPTAPKPPTTTIPAYSIDVRFGSSSDGELPRQTLQRNEALPDENDPVLVYLGVKNGGKTAVFMLSEGLKPTGDGVCTPKDTCETIELQAGETEFFDLSGDTDGTQFELDVVKIHKHATKVADTEHRPRPASASPRPSPGARRSRRAIVPSGHALPRTGLCRTGSIRPPARCAAATSSHSSPRPEARGRPPAAS